jgi:predicted anti-sigma-YlaC factor YlaD
MTCAQMRVAISAMLDGEEPAGEQSAISADQVRRHLAGCADCRSWQAGAVAVNDAVHRSAAAAEPPDLVERVLAAAPAPSRLADGPVTVLRLALGVSALAQLALTVPLLFAVAGGDGHHGREMASFDIAVAVGFLVAAIRPAKASALVPVALALVLCLFATAVVDVARSTTGLAQETGHLIVLLQAGALWALGRSGQRPGQAPVRVTA